jgi:hypothetical protein
VGGTGGKGGIEAGRWARSLLLAARSPSRRAWRGGAYLGLGQCRSGSRLPARKRPRTRHVSGAGRCHRGAYASPLLCRALDSMCITCRPVPTLCIQETSDRWQQAAAATGGPACAATVQPPVSSAPRAHPPAHLRAAASRPRTDSDGTARGISAPGLVVRRTRNGHGTPQHAKLYASCCKNTTGKLVDVHV